MENKGTILCDIGHTNFHFFYKGRIWRENLKTLTHKNEAYKIYYISVNPKFEKRMLRFHQNVLNIAPYIKLDTIYQGLGTDRAVACISIRNGLIVDAGSAITMDIMQEGIHLGGCILPGINLYREMFAKIDSLDMNLNLHLSLDSLPQNTQDAISFGALKGVLSVIETLSKKERIYFTGGDGKYLSQFFPHSIYDDTLIFKGMLKVIEENNI